MRAGIQTDTMYIILKAIRCSMQWYVSSSKLVLKSCIYQVRRFSFLTIISLLNSFNACIKCSLWCHRKCVDITNKDSEVILTYLCPFCAEHSNLHTYIDLLLTFCTLNEHPFIFAIWEYFFYLKLTDFQQLYCLHWLISW